MDALSIIIPSYNRAEKALQTVSALLPQLKQNCKLVILDNCSDTDYLEFLYNSGTEPSSAIDSGQLQIVRNQVNIGMSANFLRAFEICDTEWMWMISDDDSIHPDAVDNITKEISFLADKPDVAFVKFSSKGCEEKEQRYLSNIEELSHTLARSKHYFNSYIFLSNGLYRFPHFKTQIQTGYKNLHTYVPHLMMLLDYIYEHRGKSSILLSDSKLASYVVPDMGYSYGVVAGLGVGAFKNFRYNLKADTYLELEGVFAPHNDFKVAIDLFYDGLANSNMFVARRLAENYYLQIRSARNLLQRLAYRTLTFFFYAPKLLDRLIRLMQQRSPKLDKHVSEIKLRYCTA